MAQLPIGVVGLGNMGRGIAGNLACASRPLWVWDPDPEACAPFADRPGVRVAEPVPMAGHCAVVFFVVPSSVEIAPLLGGAGGMLRAARCGLVLYDLTTSDPDHSRSLARRAARAGVPYLDAGMSGGAAGAAAGTITLMVGGDRRAFARTRRHLDPIAGEVFHLGPSGAGHTCKLIHNMVCHTIFLATCEGAHLAERAGLDVAGLIQVFNRANARSYASEVRFPRDILSGRWEGRSSVFNLHKDLSMGVALGEAFGVDTGFSDLTLEVLDAALRLGLRDQDFTLLYRDYARIRAEASARPRPVAPRSVRSRRRRLA